MKNTRLDAMEQYILQNEEVTIPQLQKHFDVSVNTLRRDLDELERRGHVAKIYGGAASRTPPSLMGMPERFHTNAQNKRLIGELAASVIPNDATLFIDSGSTTYNLIRNLNQHRRLTLITHSLLAMNEASRLKKVNSISLGGIYNASIGAYVGISTFDVLKTMSVQIGVMAATGVSIKRGLTNTTYFEAEIKRLVSAQCDKVVLMVDHTKFDREALTSYCPLERVSTVITDLPPPRAYMEFFSERGIELLSGK